MKMSVSPYAVPYGRGEPLKTTSVIAPMWRSCRNKASRERCCDGPQKALATIFMPHVRSETVSTSELLLYGEAIAKLPPNIRRRTISKPLSSGKWIFKHVKLLDFKKKMMIVPYLCLITNLNFDDLMKRNLSENCETALQDSTCVCDVCLCW